MDARLALRELADALFPERCVVCDRFGASLHPACIPALAAADPPRCACCWAPSPASPCVSCREAPPAFEGLRTPFRFEGAVRRALLEAKFRGVTSLLAPLAASAAEAVPSAWRPTLVVPVPLHRARQRTRGYNQAAIAAEVVARRLGLRVASPLRRVRSTPPQASLDAAHRASNVAAAFASAPVAGERVLLLDDITTTGATLDACSRAILDAGADAVFALAIARED